VPQAFFSPPEVPLSDELDELVDSELEESDLVEDEALEEEPELPEE